MKKIVQKIILAFALLLAACTNHNDLISQFEKAQSLSEQGNYNAAIKIYKSLIAKHSQNIDNKSLATLNFEIGNAKKLIITKELPNDEELYETYKYFENAVRLDPDEPYYLRFKGTLLSHLGAYDEAEATYKKMALLEGNDAHWSKVRLGGLYRQLEQFEKSIETFDSISENSKNTMPVNYHKALTYLKIGLYDQAIASIENGIKHQDDYAYAYKTMACAKAMIGEYKGALDDFDTGLNLTKQNKNPYIQHSPSKKHETAQNKKNRRYLNDLANGRIQLTAQMKDSLCFASWWDIHYQKIRTKSPLLEGY